MTKKKVLSMANEYWLPKERFNELRHFCYQYPSWHKALACIDSMSSIPRDVMERVQSFDIPDPTLAAAEAREYYTKRIDMVEHAAELADPIIGGYIIRCVIDPVMSYAKINSRDRIPCNEKKFYKLYRKFFWYLSQIRE